MARLNIAMLSEEGKDLSQEVAPQIVEDHLEILGQQVEDDMLQVQRQASQSQSEDAAVEDAVQATEDLMEEQAAAEELSARGEDATQAALESIQRNVKNILKNIGLESMQTTKTNYSAEALGEDISNFIKKIWEKIKEVWARIVDAIKGFFKNLFSASVGLKKRAAAVKEAAKKLKDKKLPDEVKFTAPESVKSNMRLDYKPIPAATLDKGLSSQNDTMARFIANLTSKQAMARYEASIGDLANKVAKDVGKSSNMDGDQIREENKEIEKLVLRGLEPVLVYFTQQKGTKVGTPAFISDRVISIDLNSITNLKVNVDKIDGSVDLKEEHDPLEIFQIERTCDVVIKQMDEYKNLDAIADDFKKFSANIEKIQAGLLNQNKETSYFVRKAQSTVASRVVRLYMDIVKTVATQARMIDLQVNKAAIDWCAASLKLYK